MQTLKSIVLTVMIFLSFARVYADDPYRVTAPSNSSIFNESFSHLGPFHWAAGGSGLADDQLELAAFNNPAALQCAGYIIETAASKKLKSTWISDINRGNYYSLPDYLALSGSFNKITFALGYYRSYDIKMSSSTPIQTVTNPEGTGEMFDFESRQFMQSAFASAAYRLNDALSFGLTMALNQLCHEEKIYKNEAEGSGTGYSIIAGILFKPLENLNLACAFKSFSQIEYDVELKNGSSLVRVEQGRYDGEDSYNYISNDFKYPYRARFPFIVETGIRYQVRPSLKLMAKIDFQNWSGVNDKNENPVNYYLGAELLPLNKLAIGVGFFTKNHSNSNFGEYLDQKFISAGLRLYLTDELNFSASWAGSELFAGDDSEKYMAWDDKQFSQNIFLAGISFRLNKQEQ